MTVNIITKNSGKLLAAKKVFEKYGITVNQIDKEYPEIQAENSLEIAKFYHQTCLKSYIDLTGFCLDNIIQNV